MSMSDPKKSTNSRTEAFVTLIPSRKWSSVFPRNIAEWSSGTHRFFFRRRAVSSDPIAILNTHTRDVTIDRHAARSS